MRFTIFSEDWIPDLCPPQHAAGLLPGHPDGPGPGGLPPLQGSRDVRSRESEAWSSVTVGPGDPPPLHRPLPPPPQLSGILTGISVLGLSV